MIRSVLYESNRQLIEETRAALPAESGLCKKVDHVHR